VVGQGGSGILGTKSVKWNFTKFLIGRDGQMLGRYAPTDAPKSLIADIKRLWRPEAV
jgi:glutathione peroxidase